MWKICHAENADVYPGIIARNNAVLEYEKFIHRTYHPYIIHPYSKFRLVWEFLTLGMITFRLTIIVFIWGVLSHVGAFFHIIVLLLEIFSLIDVCLNFFTGYIEHSTKTIVLDFKKISKRYLLTYFLPDFLPSIPVPFVLLQTETHWLKTPESAFVYDTVVNICMLCVILRLFTFWKYYLNLSRIVLWNPYLWDMICLIFTFYIILLFFNDFFQTLHEAGLIYTHIRDTGEVPEINSLERLTDYFHVLFNLFLFCIFYEENSKINDYAQVVIILSSFFFSLLINGCLVKYVTYGMQPNEKFLDLESRVLSFVRKRHLPAALRNKTLLYFRILEANKYSRKDEIFNYIPNMFKADIFFHFCLPLLRNFYAFEDLPNYVLRLLAESMSYQLYLPNEMVMESDKISMYFVQRGTVALYSSKHVELYHFEGGSSFLGRQMVLGDTVVNVYAISIEVSEVYRLDQIDFLNIMRTYPKLMKRIQERCQKDKSGNSSLFE